MLLPILLLEEFSPYGLPLLALLFFRANLGILIWMLLLLALSRSRQKSFEPGEDLIDKTGGAAH
jgi:hypothetical protein